MSKFFASVRRLPAKIAAVPILALVAVQAHATGIDTVLDAVDLSGIETKVTAACLIIVGIALVFKGPTLAKRVISRV